MFHVTVFDNSNSTESEFTFDDECIAEAFVRGLHNIDTMMVEFYEAVVLPSGRTVYEELLVE